MYTTVKKIALVMLHTKTVDSLNYQRVCLFIYGINELRTYSDDHNRVAK